MQLPRRPERRAGGAPATPPASRWGGAAALVLLAVAGAAAWWPVLGAGLLWAIPVVLLSALLSSRIVRPRVGIALLVLWVPVGLLLGGVPVDALRPGALGDTSRAFGTGLDALTVPDRGAIVRDPWPLGSALVLVGVVWGTAGALSVRPGRSPAALALALTSMPLVAALALEQTADAGWPGAVVLAAGLLWA
ncbi:hypothetical protein AB0L40_27360, partial [Patulibacter sp. NPDC049589]